MGTNYCINCHKNGLEQNDSNKENNTNINKISSNYTSFSQHNYNNFTKKFNSKLHFLGDISTFQNFVKLFRIKHIII